MDNPLLTSSILFAVALAHSGCVPDSGGTDEVASQSDSTDTGSDGSTSTDTSSDGSSESTDTGSESTGSESTDSDSTDSDSTDSDSTDTSDTSDTGDTDTGDAEYIPPSEAEFPCVSLGGGAPQVIGAYAEQPDGVNDFNGRLSFVRGDGSDFLVREAFLANYSLASSGDSVLILEESVECPSTSSASMVERDSGILQWDGLDLPYAVALTGANMQGDGRVVIDGQQCDDPEPYFMVLDGQLLLDSGYGRPVHQRVRADDWLSLFRPYYENEPLPEDQWRWRNIMTKQELGPTHTFADWGSWPLYLAGGELVYFADVDGTHAVVVEEPGSVQVIDTLDVLVDQGWQLQLAWRSDYEVGPHRWDSEWTLIRAFGPEPARWFALTPEHTIVEVTPLPPPGQAPLACYTPGLDDLGRLLMPWFDGNVAHVWLEATPDNWLRRSMAMIDVGQVSATMLSGTVYVSALADSFNNCADVWGQAPPEVLSGQGGQYIRNGLIFRPPANGAHRADPSARCVAYPQTVPFQASVWGTQWSIHDLENNELFVLPDWARGRFHWFGG